jgi:hypothetical protein
MADEITVVTNATRVMRPLGGATQPLSLPIHQAPSRLKPGERL